MVTRQSAPGKDELSAFGITVLSILPRGLGSRVRHRCSCFNFEFLPFVQLGPLLLVVLGLRASRTSAHAHVSALLLHGVCPAGPCPGPGPWLWQAVHVTGRCNGRTHRRTHAPLPWDILRKLCSFHKTTPSRASPLLNLRPCRPTCGNLWRAMPLGFAHGTRRAPCLRCLRCGVGGRGAVLSY